MGFVRILLQQGPGCTWFGAAVPCSLYTRLAVAIGCIAALNVALLVSVTLAVGQATLISSAGSLFRVAVTANTAIMLCQLGGITITALKVFSDLQQPEGAATPRLRREAAFAIASCASTLASFCANVFGMRGVFDTLRAAAVSVRASVASAVRRRSAVAPVDASAAPPPPGSCGQPPYVARLPDSTVQVE